MSLEYIRTHYGVPAHPGSRVKYTGGRHAMTGTITGAEGAHLLIRLDGQQEAMPYHPTWKIEYLDARNTQPSADRQITHDADCLSFFVPSPGPCDCSASCHG
jgi:hypothetical protein